MGISALAFWLERTRLGALLTGTVIVILLSVLAANVGLIPHRAMTYDFVFEYLVPILIPLFLLQGDIRRLYKEAYRTTAAFMIASAGTVLGVLAAISLLDLSAVAIDAGIDPDQKKAAIAGLFAATYIGGSVNYAAMGEITGLARDASFFSAATAADNLFSALYLSILGLLPTLNWLANRYHRPAAPPVSEAEPAPAPSARSLCFALAIATLLVAAADALTAWSQLPGMKYIWLTLLTLLISTLLPRVRFWCAGGFELGVVLSFPFFGSIAAGADIASMLMVAPILIALVVILLAIHILFLLVAGHWLKLSLPELITASNAAVLGATTAPAMAAAKGWTDQITPGVLVGVLGYALGTLIGSALFHML
ncbi:DUF819 family protein [Luminiphilus sp.]|nr:DUF819 family protein [Luminiphilus sp.]